MLGIHRAVIAVAPVAQKASLADNLLDFLHNQLIVAGKFIGFDLLNACRIAQSIINQLPVSGLYITIDLSSKCNAVTFTKLFKTGFVHPDMIFFSVEHLSVRKHAADKNPFEADILSFGFLNLPLKTQRNIEIALSKIRAVMPS